MFDASEIRYWNKFITDGAVGSAIEAADYANDSIERWQKHADKGCAIHSLEDFAVLVAQKPKEDLVFLLVIEADWWSDDLVAFAYFRRTWAGSLYMEYLAKHPLTANKGLPDFFVGGVTEGILVGLSALIDALQRDSRLAEDARPSWVWWEATEGSCGGYQRFFAPTVPKDLVIVSDKELAGCASRIVHETWADAGLRAADN